MLSFEDRKTVRSARDAAIRARIEQERPKVDLEVVGIHFVGSCGFWPSCGVTRYARGCRGENCRTAAREYKRDWRAARSRRGAKDREAVDA